LSKVDILFPCWKRDEFTAASFEALTSTAPAKHVHIVSYPGCSDGPVAIMNDFLSRDGSQIFVKIDNDVILPPGWFEAGMAVMEANPDLGLLGIEPPASRTPAPWANGKRLPAPEENGLSHGLGYARCEMIGGIGFMRRSAFAGREPMRPHGPLGVGGFSDWQIKHPEAVKGWIVPPLNVFLLDRLPFEPWRSLSKRYIAEGVQRPWTNYSPADSALWDWWKDAA
jgi:hypothetical protein